MKKLVVMPFWKADGDAISEIILFGNRQLEKILFGNRYRLVTDLAARGGSVWFKFFSAVGGTGYFYCC